MIICYEGTPGSGKSYDAVRKILDNLKIGRVVYSNIDGLDQPVQREFIKLYTGLDDYELETKLITFSQGEVHSVYGSIKQGSLLVIDEAHKWFNSRNWQKPENKSFADWCSEHRHLGVDVLLITQDIDKVDSQVRSSIEWTYRYKKINFLGSLISNSYICYAFQEDGSGKPLKKISRRYEKKIFQCYKSYVATDMKEQGIQKATNILFHPVFYAIPVLIGVFIYLFAQSGFAKGQLIPGAASVVGKGSSSVQVEKKSVGGVVPAESVAVASPSPDLSISSTAFIESSIIPVSSYSSKEAYVLIGFIADVLNPDNGTVLYKPLGSTGIKMRASKLDFDRLCKCNSTARYQAGDLIEVGL